MFCRKKYGWYSFNIWWSLSTWTNFLLSGEGQQIKIPPPLSLQTAKLYNFPKFSSSTNNQQIHTPPSPTFLLKQTLHDTRCSPLTNQSNSAGPVSQRRPGSELFWWSIPWLSHGLPPSTAPPVPSSSPFSRRGALASSSLLTCVMTDEDGRSMRSVKVQKVEGSVFSLLQEPARALKLL